MLDDLKFIHEKDPQDALGVAEKQWQQLKQPYDLGDWKPNTEISNMVYSGMGGSSLGAVFVQNWPGLSVPFEIARNYQIPNYVDANTLFISASYSGNTEETLEALQQAQKAQAMIVVITNGGKLEEIAKENRYPIIKVPSVPQPRMSAFYMLAGIIQVLESVGLVKGSDELKEAADWLESQVKSWLPVVPTSNNQAKQIAQELMGKTVIVYSGPLMFPAANKLKIWINENAKNLAWANQYPEFNHNEFVGWTSHPVNKPFAVVEIRSNLEHARVQKRFKVTEKMLSGKRPFPIVVKPEGDTVLKQLLWSAVLGDLASIYLAILNGVNPTPVELVEKFKAALNE